MPVIKRKTKKKQKKRREKEVHTVHELGESQLSFLVNGSGGDYDAGIPSPT